MLVIAWSLVVNSATVNPFGAGARASTALSAFRIRGLFRSTPPTRAWPSVDPVGSSRRCEPVTNVHDFIDKTRGKAIPYGVYDVAADARWVSVGTDPTPEFAVATIRAWWRTTGSGAYPAARRQLLTCADGGGFNGYADVGVMPTGDVSCLVGVVPGLD